MVTNFESGHLVYLDFFLHLLRLVNMNGLLGDGHPKRAWLPKGEKSHTRSANDPYSINLLSHVGP